MICQAYRYLTKSSSAQDEGWSWTVLFASFVISGFTWGIQHVFGIIYSLWVTEFNSSKGTTAWITSLPIFLLYALSPVVAIIANRLHSFQMMSLVGVIICTTSLFISSYMDSILALFFTYGLMTGIGLLFLATPIVVILCDYFDRYLSFATALATVGSFVTPVFLSPMLSYITEKYDWRVSLRALAVSVLVTCLPCSLLWKKHSAQEKYKDPRDQRNKQPLKVRKSLRNYKRLLKNKRYLIFLIASLIASVDGIVSHTHLVQCAIELGIARQKANWLPTFAALGNVLGRLSFGRLYDCTFVKRLLLYRILMAVSGFAALIGSLSTTFTHLAIFASVYMIFDGGHKSQASVINLKMTGKKYYLEGWTMLLCGQSVMLLIGPSIVGSLSDLTQDYKVMFYCMAIPVMISSLILNFMSCVPEYIVEEEEVEVSHITGGSENLL